MWNNKMHVENNVMLKFSTILKKKKHQKLKCEFNVEKILKSNSIITHSKILIFQKKFSEFNFRRFN